MGRIGIILLRMGLVEVDWGGKLKLNYTSCRCMLLEVDWGGKLRVNHILECMPCESDWGAHETHQNEHSTTSNRIYPSPKSFWSCTHVNSRQNYTLYINLHI